MTFQDGRPASTQRPDAAGPDIRMPDVGVRPEIPRRHAAADSPPTPAGHPHCTGNGNGVRGQPVRFPSGKSGCPPRFGCLSGLWITFGRFWANSLGNTSPGRARTATLESHKVTFQPRGWSHLDCATNRSRTTTDCGTALCVLSCSAYATQQLFFYGRPLFRV